MENTHILNYFNIKSSSLKKKKIPVQFIDKYVFGEGLQILDVAL